MAFKLFVFTCSGFFVYEIKINSTSSIYEMHDRIISSGLIFSGSFLILNFNWKELFNSSNLQLFLWHLYLTVLLRIILPLYSYSFNKFGAMNSQFSSERMNAFQREVVQ